MHETTTVAPFKRTVTVGTIDTGYARRAAVTVEIDWDGSRLSMSGWAKRKGAADIDQGGQMQDTLREDVADCHIIYADGWGAARLSALLDVWERWHLNDMRPGCEHQRELMAAGDPEWDTGWTVTLYHWRRDGETSARVGDAERDAVKRLWAGETVTLDEETRWLAASPFFLTTQTPERPEHYKPRTYGHIETKRVGWVRHSEHPSGILGKPCPVCGYGYGTEWRREEVPAEVLTTLLEITE